MKQRTVHANGVELHTETFGDPADPPILLIAGTGASLDWWEDGLCARLAAGLRYVIRYDNRDTGASTTYPAGAPPYSGDDLVADALAVLDALGVPRAHVVGLSMGGMLAQRLAVQHPHRVATLTLLATSPDGPGDPLPPPDLPASPPEPDWADRDAVVAYLVDLQRQYMGAAGWDEARVRAIAARAVDRTPDLRAAMTNPYAADGGTPVRDRLAEIKARTLVAHGTADLLFPYAHAEALAAAIPGARLLPLDGVGHEVPPPASWDVFVPALLRHTSGGWDAQGSRLARRSIAAGDPTGWFDRLYAAAAAGESDMPWDRTTPQPLLAAWAAERRLDGTGLRAVVVGCGLGADAEFVASLGFTTTAFDIAETAIHQARLRHPHTRVDYVTADLLDPPKAWHQAFDLVVEVNTVQALPNPTRTAAIKAIPHLVAPGGTLLALPARDLGAPRTDTPPWPLTRSEIHAFATQGLTPVRVEPVEHRWQAQFIRTLLPGRPAYGR